MTAKRRFHEKLSWLLDNSIPLPGGYRIGLDGFIGLIPGLGDFFSGLLASLIVIKANQLGVPRSVLLRMVINVLIDTGVGSLPVIGDLFDFVWKANQKNSELLAHYEQAPQQTARRSLLENMLFILAVVIVLALVVMLAGWLIGLLWSRIQGY
ncbi:DUF4112 domain-containing protein [Methylophaga sp. OBS1]|uniref:DUF4112 domain-containing protein n=1 Tax=Methylophaga sp. OBS1 TaxID=2991933 RepID=UPI002255AF21|nr:DUF4112 domain-containing protein [Methylophaga sp. OBS1]MCX4192878.1 DUF4112 domain-containing protein [Methylophaga sp. OBS1]